MCFTSHAPRRHTMMRRSRLHRLHVVALLGSLALVVAAPAFARSSGHSSHSYHSSGSHHSSDSSGSTHSKTSGKSKRKRSKHTSTSIPHEKRHVTTKEKNQLFDAAGIPKSERKNYVIDHKIPLELGGTNDSSNLQVEAKGESKQKDKVENYLAGKVRHGEMSLPEAQREIQHWQSVDPSQ